MPQATDCHTTSARVEHSGPVHTGRDAQSEAQCDVHGFIVATVLYTLHVLSHIQCNIACVIGTWLYFCTS